MSRYLHIVVYACLLCNVYCQEDDFNTLSRGLDTKGMLTSLASSLMSRGYASNNGSQVVSLNLTNLLVLVLLKALIFAAGSLGAGTWKGGYARSADGEEHIISEEEMVMYLSYLTGSPGNNGCLQNIACRQPYQANRYAAAADMLLKATKMLRTETPAHEYTLGELKEAVNYGLSGGDCDLRYKCGKDNGRR